MKYTNYTKRRQGMEDTLDENLIVIAESYASTCAYMGMFPNSRTAEEYAELLVGVLSESMYEHGILIDNSEKEEMSTYLKMFIFEKLNSKANELVEEWVEKDKYLENILRQNSRINGGTNEQEQ